MTPRLYTVPSTVLCGSNVISAGFAGVKPRNVQKPQTQSLALETHAQDREANRQQQEQVTSGSLIGRVSDACNPVYGFTFETDKLTSPFLT